MTLDNVLREVEPIIQGSHFTHPSFQEVLTARRFADEINSERLSVREAYLNFWSNVASNMPKELSADYRTIRSEWRPTLKHLVSMLSDENAEEFINVVSESYFLCKKQIYFNGEKFYDIVLDDLVLCAKFIRIHPALHSRKCSKQVKKVAEELFEYFDRRSGDVEFWADPCLNYFSRIKDLYALTRQN